MTEIEAIQAVTREQVGPLERLEAVYDRFDYLAITAMLSPDGDLWKSQVSKSIAALEAVLVDDPKHRSFALYLEKNTPQPLEGEVGE